MTEIIKLKLVVAVMKPINANWTSWELDNKIMLRMKPRNRGVFRGPCTCPLEGEKIVLILM